MIVLTVILVVVINVLSAVVFDRGVPPHRKAWIVLLITRTITIIIIVLGGWYSPSSSDSGSRR